MKAFEGLNILKISRPPLTNYVKQEIIEIAGFPNRRYDYDEKSVYSFMNKDIPRRQVIHARVSTRKQKKDLENQVQLLKNYYFQNGILINEIYEDIASGMKLDRPNLLNLIKEIMNFKIHSIIISHKDRLSRVEFKLFQHLFKEFGTKIIFINDLELVSTEQEII